MNHTKLIESHLLFCLAVRFFITWFYLRFYFYRPSKMNLWYLHSSHQDISVMFLSAVCFFIVLDSSNDNFHCQCFHELHISFIFDIHNYSHYRSSRKENRAGCLSYYEKQSLLVDSDSCVLIFADHKFCFLKWRIDSEHFIIICFVE